MELKDKKTSQGIKPSNPCPFCGCLHTEILKPGQSTSGGYQIQCVNCGARGPTGWRCDQGAAQSWNNGDTGFNRPIVGSGFYQPPPESDLMGFVQSLRNCPTCDNKQVQVDSESLLRQNGRRKQLVVPFRAECGGRWDCIIEEMGIGAHLRLDIKYDCLSPSCDGFVYFLEAVGLQRIKIGYSKDPEARLKSLQTGSPVPLVEIGRIPGDQQSETDLHQQFDHLRLDGEWFHAAKQLRDYIRGLQ